MKSLTISLLLILITIPTFSQQLDKEIILGSWKVIDSQLMTEMEMGLDTEGKKKMEQMRMGFIGTILNFKEDNGFTIKFSDNIPDFMKELEFVNNKKWKIVNGQIVAIGTAEDNYSLMGVIVQIKHGKKYFILDESPFILEVVEQ